MLHVFFPADRYDCNAKVIETLTITQKEALKRAVVQLRESRNPNDHKFVSLPAKNLWISDIGGRRGGRIIYIKKADKLIIWGLGPNHDIEAEAERYFISKEKEEALISSEMTDVTCEYLSEREQTELRNKTKLFAGNLSDEFLQEVLFLNDYDIKELRKSNEISLWSLHLPDAVKFKLLQYIKLPANTILAARDEVHLEKFVRGDTEKLLIHLDEYQERIISEPVKGSRLIRGETGSGKTTILIYKAIYYAEANPSEECILFTYNLSLANLIKEAVEELAGTAVSNLKIYGVFEWISEVMQAMEKSGTILENSTTESIYKIIRENYDDSEMKLFGLNENELNLFIKKEIEEVILAYGITDLIGYLAHKRVGTEKRLGKRQRQTVWKIYNGFKDYLHSKGMTSYKLMLNEFLELIRRDDFLFRQDAIFVDEVQDLPPVCIKIISGLRKRSDSIVIIAGDYKQAIYRKSFRWSDVMLPFHGANVLILRKNYRNTHQILFTAHKMLEKFFPGIQTPIHSGRAGREVEIIKYEGEELIRKLAGIIEYLHYDESVDFSY
ncbi:MAG: AAA family ATPase, partial [Candidatus Cloacimonetes bacterium]|nr:AAA family ATPase [Candidatus Cloacimonadota bacterium]